MPSNVYDDPFVYDDSANYDSAPSNSSSRVSQIVENLMTRRETVAAELAAWIAQKPSYAIDGQSVQWESYRMSLLKELEDLNNLINMLDPYEIQTTMT